MRTFRCVTQNSTQNDSDALDVNLDPVQTNSDPVQSIDLEAAGELAKGPVSTDIIDGALGDALSKAWDRLDMFGSSGLSEKQLAVSKKEEEEEDKQTDAVDDSQDPVQVPSPEVSAAIPVTPEEDISGDLQEAKKVSKQKTTPKRGRKKKEVKAKDENVFSQKQREKPGDWELEPQWYVVQVKPGCEQSCAISIRNMAASLEDSNILDVLVPTTKIMRLTKAGKSVKKEERFFPGSILVFMAISQQNYAEIQRVPNVQFFMGDPNREKKKNQPFLPPAPISQSEIKAIFEKIKDAESVKPERKTSVRPGDSIKVISGAYEGNRGRIMEVKPDLNIIKANLFLFGRETPVELEFNQIKVVADASSPREKRTKRGRPSKAAKRKAAEDKDREETILGSNVDIASPGDDLALLLGEEGDDWDVSTEYDETSANDSDSGFDEAQIGDVLDTVKDERKVDLVPNASERKRNNTLRRGKKGSSRKVRGDEDILSMMLQEDDDEEARDLLQDDLLNVPKLDGDKEGDGFTEAKTTEDDTQNDDVVIAKASHGSRRKAFGVVSPEDLSRYYISGHEDSTLDEMLLFGDNLDTSLSDEDGDEVIGTREDVNAAEIRNFFGDDDDIFGVPDVDANRGATDVLQKSEDGFLKSVENEVYERQPLWSPNTKGPTREADDPMGFGGPAIWEEMNERMRKAEVEGDITYVLPKPGYNDTEPIVVVDEDVEISKVDLFNDIPEEFVCEEFDYAKCLRSKTKERAEKRRLKRHGKEGIRKEYDADASPEQEATAPPVVEDAYDTVKGEEQNVKGRRGRKNRGKRTTAKADPEMLDFDFWV